jgi:PAS domain S-box-containing protein
MRVITTGAAVVLMVFSIFLIRPTPVADLDARVCDVLTGWAGPGVQSRQVAIVEIDERSLARYGRWPWRRDVLGRLSREILDHGAATVVLDIMFPQEDRGNDEVLAGALSGKPAVIGYTLRFDGGGTNPALCPASSLPLVVAGPNATLPSGDAGSRGGSRGTPFFHASGAVCSVPAISRAAAGSGFLNAAPDHDGVMRHLPLVIESGDGYYPSMAVSALKVYRDSSNLQLTKDSSGTWMLRLDDQTIPVEGGGLLRLRFRGPSRRFPYISAADVLSGGVREEVLRGKIVVVGGSAPGMLNPVVTAVDPLFPDVEIQATSIDNLLQGDSFRRPGSAQFWELLCALIAGTTSTLLLTRRPFWWGALAIPGLVAGAWVGCALVLAWGGMLFSPLAVTAMLVCNVPVLTLLNYLQEKNRADRTTQQLAATRQRSLEELRESESRYQRLVDNINDAIIVDDVAGRLVFANRRFREWFGLQEGEIGSVVLEQYVAPEWRAEMRDRHDRRMRGENVPDHFEFEGIRPDGTRIWIEALVTKVEEEGRTTGTQAALRDTTERKRIEAQYLQARKMETVGRLAGGVAHDFNNLLTVINAYSDLLLGQMSPGDQSRRSLEEIRKAGDRAAELTKKLLAFSRKQFVQPKPVNLNLLVAESERMLERLIGEDIELITHLSPDLGYVTADPGQMHQVLMNLVVNARDAMPQGGKVIIETRNVAADETANASVYLGVTDSGTGMSEEVKQHLFEPFFTTKDPGKGTGLGLATVYGIVHQIGGRIDAVSELGKGTSFHIYLPYVKPSLPEKTGAPVKGLALGGWETVLVVEDQDAVRQLAVTVLQNYGYRVLQASNGPDAMALAERYGTVIHLLVTDVIMPLMDGRVLADRLRAARPGIKVLYVSGYSEDKIGSSSALDADMAYLPKPFTPDALAARVREILGEGGAQGRTAVMGVN